MGIQMPNIQSEQFLFYLIFILSFQVRFHGGGGSGEFKVQKNLKITGMEKCLSFVCEKDTWGTPLILRLYFSNTANGSDDASSVLLETNVSRLQTSVREQSEAMEQCKMP